MVNRRIKRHSNESACISTSSVLPAPSAEVVAPHSKVKSTSLSNIDSVHATNTATPSTASISKTTPKAASTYKTTTSTAAISTTTTSTASTSKTTPSTAAISTTTPSTASTIKSVTRQFVAPPSEATVSKTETSTIPVLSETTVSSTVTGSTNKTNTTVSSDGQITSFNDSHTCDDKMAPTSAILCAPPFKKKTGTSSVNTRQSSQTTEEKMDRKSSKRKRPETRSVPNKRVLQEQSADDTRLSYRWLWSIETLMEQLCSICLAFEGFFL